MAVIDPIQTSYRQKMAGINELPASVERHNNDNKHGHIRKKFFSII